MKAVVMNPKHMFFGFAVIMAVVVAFATAGSVVETVDGGTYHVKQAAISGEMSAHMQPGLYFQNFGSIQVWPVSETFYFTHDSEEGSRADQSFEVRFNDGSLCNVSGTLRVLMPTSPADAINLRVKDGYREYTDVEQKLIKPTVRNVLRLTANLMSARESYTVRRSDFDSWARDQIQNGLYETSEEVREVEDLVSGEKVKKAVKVIKRDATGMPIHKRNPLDGTGITLANFEIKTFEYEDRVKTQITKQQEALMAVETAKAKAQEAEQDKITVEAQGKAAVMKAQYQEEEKKIQAIVQAQRDSATTVIAAQKELESARLGALAAEQTKRKEILLGQGEAERKKLAMQADGALKQKIDGAIRINEVWAEAYGKKAVPSTLIEGGSGEGGSGLAGEVGVNTFMAAVGMKAMKDLQLDMKVSK
jgi:hypothetical protein